MQNHLDSSNLFVAEPDYKQILHDVRIQMHTISSALQVMGRYTEERALLTSGMDITYFHEIIRDAVIKGIGLLNEALPAKETAAAEEPFCVITAVRNILSGLSVLAESMDFSIEYKGPEKLILPGGRTKLERILYNLVTNALNHTPGNSTILVEVEKHNGDIKISVTDQGSGLSPEQRGVLCSPLPFPVGTEDMYGLRNIRNLAEELGGRLAVENSERGNSIAVFVPTRRISCTNIKNTP